MAEGALSEELLNVLVCPIDKEYLLYSEKENYLYNPRLKKRYEIIDSIPILLAEKAYDVDEQTHKSIMQSETRQSGSN